MAVEKTPNYRYYDESDDETSSGLDGFIKFCDWTIVVVATILTVLIIGIIWLCKFHLMSTANSLGLTILICLLGWVTIYFAKIKPDIKEAITGIAAGLGIFILLILGIISGVIAIASQAWAQVAFIMTMMFLTVMYERIHIESPDDSI